MMIIESLNIGLPKEENFQDKTIRTGISKRPVSGPIELKKLGFAGDGVADTKHHGGPDKAVCVYGINHYPHWEEIVGPSLSPPAFGENLSVSHLNEEEICIGDIFQVGTAVVQVSQPRRPCATLAARFGRTDMAKLVVDSGHTGFYFKVLEGGTVEPGSAMAIKERDPRKVSISFANRIFHHDRKNQEGIERVLAVPALSASWRQSFQKLKEVCQ